jgi:glutamyl-tRNA synthetase
VTDSNVRVRFCPSPTGNPHVGMVRTALFNWAYARHTGGTFVFRIEDTDSARDSEESYEALLEALTWLGLDWDEGPGKDPAGIGPFRQSERMVRGDYRRIADLLRGGGFAYDCYCSPEELEERRERAMAEKRPPGYDRHCRSLSAEQVAAYAAAGRQPALRFRMPDADCTWDDLVRGPITFAADQVPDYVLVRANGEPLYTLTNPVDDAAMGVTHVLRGEDLLSSTPRQIALHDALVALGESPARPMFGHLPYVMGEGNRKLSKRDPESSLQWYRDEGYLPEALLNYLALLGWSMGEDREFFSLDEMAGAFTLDRVSPNPARFDLKKATAINGDWIRRIDVADLVERIIPFLVAAGVVTEPLTPDQRDVLDAAVPLVQERMETLRQSVGMLAFLLLPAERFEVDPTDAAAVLTDDARPVIEASVTALAALDVWRAEPIEQALRSALIDGLGLKPKVAFGPVRVAVSGRRVSPPLFESLEILGRERTLERLRAAG